MFSITSWNINGLRSVKNLPQLLADSGSNIVCLQETKITRDQLTSSVACVDGYNSYFDFSQQRAGYSGVATFCRDDVTPKAAETGLCGWRETQQRVTPDSTDSVRCYGAAAHLSSEQKRATDTEGRCVITLHHTTCQCGGGGATGCLLAVVNVYCPRASQELPHRQQYQLAFFSALQDRVSALLARGNHVIVVGDLNCAHKQLDHCQPRPVTEFWSSQYRQQLDAWLLDDHLPDHDVRQCPTSAVRLVDTYRRLHRHTRHAYTCWNSQTGARAANFGTRIDYVLCDAVWARCLLASHVCSHVSGSDHCPVRAEFSVTVTAASRRPASCTSFYDELSGRQVSLQHMWQRASQQQAPNSTVNCSERSLNKPTSTRTIQTKLSSYFLSPSRRQYSAATEVSHSRTNSEQDTETKYTTNSDQDTETKYTTNSDQDTETKYTTNSDQDTETKYTTNSDQDTETKYTTNSDQDTETKYTTNSEQDTETSHEQQQQKSQVSSTDDQHGSCVQAAVCPSAAAFWRDTLTGSRVPVCRGHGRPCVHRVVRKQGVNRGRGFWACSLGAGLAGDPLARCQHFQWS